MANLNNPSNMLYVDDSTGQPVAVSTTDGLPVSQENSGLLYSATVTRPANTTPYTANDVVGGALTFSGGSSSASEFMITSAEFELDISAIPSGMTSFALWLYSATPPSAIADNSAFDFASGDRSVQIGLLQLGTPVDYGSTCYVRTDGLNSQISVASGGQIFAYLVTAGGYTPAANSQIYKIRLHGLPI